MTFYIEKEGTILLHDEDKQRLENTKLFMPDLAELEVQETDRKIITHNDIFVFADTVLDDLALQIKNDLIEKVNYPLKEKVAYTGVLFTKDGQDLCFETNNNSMAMINFILTQILAGALTSVANWKCRRVEAPHEPVSVDFTVEQFQQLVQFAGVMVTSAFAVEKEINAQIEALTVEQLNNEEFVEGLKIQMEAAYAQVPVRLEGLFPEPEVEELPELPEVEEEVPAEDEVVDNTDEPVVE